MIALFAYILHILKRLRLLVIQRLHNTVHLNEEAQSLGQGVALTLFI